jgi:hypothetical protein
MMVNFETIKRFGTKLRNSDIKRMTTTQLSRMLTRYTGSHGKPTLQSYIKLLKDFGFIEFTEEGRWEILRKGQTLLVGKPDPEILDIYIEIGKQEGTIK